MEAVFHEDRLAEARQRAGTFVLLTNATELTARELLLEYKGQQTAVEIPFRVLKALPVSLIFVKTPRRVEALAWVILLAYLLYALMQYPVRQALQQQGKALRSPVRKADMRPTGRSILDMLLHIYTARIRLPDGTVTRSLVCNNPNIFLLLELLQIHKGVFTAVPSS